MLAQEILDPLRSVFKHILIVYEWNWLPHLLVVVRPLMTCKFQGFWQGEVNATVCPLLSEALHVYMCTSVLYMYFGRSDQHNSIASTHTCIYVHVNASQWQGVGGCE